MNSVKSEWKNTGDALLECERPRVYLPLTFLGGFYGGFTYAVRGGVFCNAQTANFVLCAIALANADWMRAIYFVIPMTAYMMGIMLSEIIGTPEDKKLKLRRDTVLIGIEIIVVFILGLIPDSAPYQISQIIVNFLAAMQWNTFRKVASIPVATTFLTNHWRQVGVQLAKKIASGGEKGSFRRAGFHVLFIVTFMAGVIVSANLCKIFSGRGIWFAIIPLLFLFCDLLCANNMKYESSGKDEKN